MKTSSCLLLCRGAWLGLVGLLALASGCSKASRAARHFERAEAYRQAGERDKAEIEYLNALRLQPQDPRPIERLGRLYYEQGRFPRALAFLLRTRELDTNHVEARLRAAQILSALGQNKEARAEAEWILDHQPTNEEALLVLAESPRGTNDLVGVEQRLGRLRSVIGDTPGYYLAQATLAMMRRDSNTAAQASLAAVQRGPQSMVAHQVRGAVLLAFNDLTNAIQAFETAARLAPERSLIPLRLAELYLQTGDRARGRAVISNFLARASDYLPAQLQMLKLDLAEGRLDDCEAMLTRVLSRESTLHDALLARGQLLLARGKPETALKEMERVVGLHPKSPQAQYQYAVTLLVNGDQTKAASALDQALTLDPNLVDAILLRARLHMRRGDTATAIRALTELLRRRPGLVPARLTLAEAHGLRGEFAPALAIFDALIKEYPREPQFHFLRGLVLRDLKKPDEAYAAFEQARALAPESPQVLRQMVEVQLTRQQFDAARRLLAEPLAKDPKAAEPRVLLALTYVAQRDLARAEEILTQTLEVAPEARAAYLLLAQVLSAAGKQQQALERLEQALAKNPKDVPAWMQVGMLRDSLGRYEQAAQAYRKLLEVNPRFQPALNNLAYLLSEQFQQVDEALELARRARELAPQDPATADTLGWIAWRKGDYARAQTLLEEAAQGLPSEPEIQYHLGMVHYMLGQEDAARAALQRALAENTRDYRGKDQARAALELLNLDPERAEATAVTALEQRLHAVPADPVAARRLAAICERRGEVDRAVRLYEGLLKANPRALFALLRLAELQVTRLNNPARALELARQARNLDPEGALTAQQAGRVALRAGDVRWAYSLLQDCLRKAPDAADVRFDYALAAYQIGRVSEAESHLEALLKTGATNVPAASLRTWTELVRATARPELAPAAAPTARALLQTNPDALPALMVLALADEQQGRTAAARAAYERLRQLAPDFAPAMRHLALLRVRAGDSDPAVLQLASRAREAFPQDAELAAALGELSLRRGDAARAAQLLSEALRQQTNRAEWWFQLGLAHHQQKQGAQARPALQRALELKLPEEQAARARQVLAELK